MTRRSAQWFLVFTDNADLDAMLFFSPALARVLEAWGSPEKLADLGGTPSLRQRIYDELKVVSVLRAVNAQENLGLPFDAIDLEDVVSVRTFTLNLNGLLDRMANASGHPRSLIEDRTSRDAPTCRQTGEPLVHGGDCLTMVGIALRRLIGALSKQQIANGFAERSTRLALHPGDLDATSFAKRVMQALAQATP